MRFHGFDDCTAGHCKGHIVGITGVGDDNLIAWIKTCHIGKHDCFRTARSDDNLIGRYINSILCIIPYHLCSQGQHPLRGRVCKYITLKRRNSIFGAIGRLNVGLTNVERIDVNTITVCRFCILCQLTNWRLRHALCAFRDFHGKSILRISGCKITKNIAHVQEIEQKFAYLFFL